MTATEGWTGWWEKRAAELLELVGVLQASGDAEQATQVAEIAHLAHEVFRLRELGADAAEVDAATDAYNVAARVWVAGQEARSGSKP